MLDNKYKIIFFGSSDFSVQVLEELLAHEAVDGVVSTPAKPAGRDQILTPTPISSLAQKNNIPLWEPEDLKDKDFLKTIESIHPDLFVVVAYGKILPQTLLDIPSGGAINIHGSLLPKYRGSSPIQAALLSGDTETGITFMLMDSKVDHGPILVKKTIKINKRHTYSSLSKEMSLVAAKNILPTLRDFVSGKIKPMPQQDEEATYVQTITKEDGHIDFSKSAQEISNQLKAFEIWPQSYAFWKKDDKNLRLKIIKANTEPQSPDKESLAGTVLQGEKGVFIQTGGGILIPEKIQLEGQTETDIKSFCNGHTDFIGTQLF